MRLFKRATHLLLPVMDSQPSCVFAQLTGQWVLRMVHDVHKSIGNADRRAHIWNARATAGGVRVVT